MATTRRTRVSRIARAIVGWVSLTVFLLMVTVWTAFGFAPELAANTPEPIASLARPSAFWPIFLAFVACFSAAWALSTSVRGGTHVGGGAEARLSPAAAGLLGSSAMLMAFASYWPCTGNESPIWAGLRHALETFAGSLYEPFGIIEGCPAHIPQALQAASLFALIAVALTVALAIAYIFRAAIQRIRVYAAHQVIVFSTVSDETIDAAREVRRNLTSRQKLVFLDTGVESYRVRAIAREIGALVLEIDVNDEDAVRRFLRTRGKRGIQGLYLLSPNSAANLESMENFLKNDESTRVPRLAPRRSEVPGRIVVRVDNPWHAEDWRRTQMIGKPGWLFDAISVHEVAARHVVHKLKSTPHPIDTVIIDGATIFDLAILTELSFEHLVDHVLRDASETGRLNWGKKDRSHPFEPYLGNTPRAVLVGSQAEDTATHFRVQLQRYGISNVMDVVQVMPEATAVQAMSRFETEGKLAALIVKSSDQVDSTFLAVRHPTWTIFDWNSEIRGVTEKPMLGNLSMVGPTLKPTPGYGLDIWDRLGRIQHQIYLLNFQGGVADRTDPKRTIWEDSTSTKGLSSFARENNIRSFANFTRTVANLDRRRKLATDLGPNGTDAEAPLIDPTEITELAILEHQSWVRHHVEHGYKYGAHRKGKRHPDIVEWDRLAKEEKQKDMQNVRATYELLKALGFVLTDSS